MKTGPPETPPRLLTIAGSDSGGGAGIQADLKTFAAHGAYGMSAVTAITAQNTRAVDAIHPVPVPVVTAQIDAVFDDLGVDAVKIGMLASAELVRAVAERLAAHRPRHVVLDPVMVAKSGDPLLEDTAVTALVEELLPLATVVTPNLPEAARLTGLDLTDPTVDQMAAAARLVAAMGNRGEPSQASPAVLLKGGHGDGETLTDLLFDGGEQHRYDHPRIRTRSTHGTGCTLSSAVAARLARGDALPMAVGGAIDYLWGAIRNAQPLGGGHGPVNHLYLVSAEALGGGE
ncbi:MAG: bifunctional hydroxymethylpyrimidine kinase/phosphomethylpyrimidine kinase [Acidobacteriota bacterium]